MLHFLTIKTLTRVQGLLHAWFYRFQRADSSEDGTYNLKLTCS